MAHGEEDLFHRMKPFVICGPNERDQTQVEAAEALKSTPRAFWNRLQRFKHRYRVLLTDKIGQTVASSADIAGELRYLQRLFTEHPR